MRQATVIFWALIIISVSFGQGTPHSILGSAQNSDLSAIPPGCGTFIAYPYPAADDTLTQDSDGCGFSGSDWWIEISELGLEDGDTIGIFFLNTCNGETLRVLVEIDLSEPSQNIGTLTLLPGISVITVLYPNGGETFEFGDGINIQWNASAGIATVNIFYTTNGGSIWNPVASGVSAAAGNYPWVAPSVESNQYLVKIEDASDPSVFDVSDNFFEVVPAPMLDLTSPSGGEIFLITDTINIGWLAAGVALVDIYFSSNAGADWLLVVDSFATGASGSYDFPAPDTVSDECMIRIWDTDDHSIVDVSGLFTIDTVAATDTTPPSAVLDLAIDSTTYTDVLLSWTLTGDDGVMGTPTATDLRFNTVPITEANWAVSTPVGGLPAPDTSGTHQSVWVFGLTSGETYYFAMKLADEVPNWSELSNVVNTTLPEPPDTTPPGEFPLSAGDIGCDRATISWDAPGDDGSVGTADHYEFRYANYELDATNFDTGTLIAGVPAPDVAGTPQQFTITGLDTTTEYWVAGYAYDEVDNRSNLMVVSFTTTFCEDTTAPARINLINCEDFRPDATYLSWIAPGDDGFSGHATSYEVRYSTEIFDAETWVDATPYPLAMIPGDPGDTEYAWIDGLESAQYYYFAVFALDEVGNRSHMGNLTYCTTMGVVNPVDDVYTFEDATDFMLADLAEIFVPDGLNLYAEAGDGISIYYEDGVEDSSEVWVHLEPNWWGDTYVYLIAEHIGYLSIDTVIIHIESVNDLPYFTSGTPDSVAIPGIDYEFTFTAADLDGDSLTFFLSEGPSGMTIYSSGELFWSPPPTEGHYDVTVGVTDGQDSSYYGFPVRVFKLTDTLFAPRNLVAYSDFAGSIPLSWDIPQAVLLGFPVHLVGYNIYRSDEPDGEPVLIGTSDVNTYNDALVVCGATKYYRAKAVYDVPSFESAYSNTDAGMCNAESGRIYSPWTSTPVLVDGYNDDYAWELGISLQIPYGYTLSFVNTASYLYGFIQFSELPEDSQEFSFWFDDDNSGFWDVMPSDEGRIFFRYGDSVKAYFQPVADIGGSAIRGTSVEMPTASSAWRVEGTSTFLEFAIPLGEDDHFGALPGDSSAVMFIAENSTGPIFRWMASSDELVPVSYGRIIIGMPGGVPSVVVSPTSMEFTLEQGQSTQATMVIQNLGEGTGYYSLSGMPDWISAVPSAEFLYPGLTQNVTVEITADMEPGDYVGYINVYTTDPYEPIRQVDVTLHITPLEPENHLEISLPVVVRGSIGAEVMVPVSVGELYDNDITQIRFTLFNQPDVAMPVGIIAGDALPGSWSIETTSIGEDHITVHLHGVEPLPMSGVIVNMRYDISDDGWDGMATELNFSDVTVNMGFPIPSTSDGLIVVGDNIVPYWSAMVVLVLPDESRADSVTFGVHPLASDAYDAAIDAIDPPSFPGSGNIYFLAQNGYQLARDLRHKGDTLLIFPLIVEQTGRIEWDVNRVWSGCFIGDTLNMKTNSYIDVEPDDTLYIYYHHTTPFECTISLKSGWNMVSIPIDVDSVSLSDVFPDAISPAFYYDPLSESYIPTPVLFPGRGYWVLMTEDHDYVFSGEPLLEYELELPDGWNMIGAPAQAVYWDEQAVIPDGALLPGALFGFNAESSSYFIADALVPTNGYWTMVLENCFIRISAIYGGPHSSSTKRK